MVAIDFHVGPRVEGECRGSLVCADTKQVVELDDVPTERGPAGDALELPELLQWVDTRVRIRADADSGAAPEHATDGEVAVAEVRLGRRTDADPRPGLGEEVELGVVGVRGVDDRGLAAEASRLGAA